MSRDREYTSEISEYVVLTLRLDDYAGSRRQLSDDYHLVAVDADRTPLRETERNLLQRYFRAWRKPFVGTLTGFRSDSPILICHGDELVAGVYLCDDNELGRAGWGQLHYAFMNPEHKGRGIYSVIFREAVERARRWRLEGLILNSDRHLLPDVYIRWGAKPFTTRHKSILRRLLAPLWYPLADFFAGEIPLDIPSAPAKNEDDG